MLTVPLDSQQLKTSTSWCSEPKEGTWGRCQDGLQPGVGEIAHTARTGSDLPFSSYPEDRLTRQLGFFTNY